MSIEFNGINLCVYSISQNVNVTEIIDSLLVNYDKRLRPNFNGEYVDADWCDDMHVFSHISEVQPKSIIQFRDFMIWNETFDWKDFFSS